jgi:flagellar assembly protein FliH
MDGIGRERRGTRFATTRYRHVTGDGKDAPAVRAVTVKDLAEQARGIVEQARAQAAEIERQAYHAGFAQGEKAGQKTALDQLAPYLGRFQALTTELARLRDVHLKAIEPQILDLALVIARKVVHHAIEADPAAVRHVAAAAIQAAVDRARVTVRVAPSEHALLATFRPELLRIEGVKDLTIEADDRIAPGGCVVEGNGGEIDARTEVAFAEFEKLRDAYDA